jgi:phosphatidylglycerophosphate synthase
MRVESAGSDGGFRARDCLLLPNLVSFLRLPLGVAFPWVSDRPNLALGLLLAAAGTDVLDGFLARRLGQVSAAGAIIDGVFDKSFAGFIIGSLLWQQRVSLAEACLLGARELGELPLVLWWTLDRSQRRIQSAAPRANGLGKLATVIQFFSIAAILKSSSLRTPSIAITAVCGAASAAAYWRRQLTAAQRRVAPGR